MKKKKMLLLFPCFLPTGAVNVAVSLVEELKKLDYQLEIISRMDGPVKETFQSMGVAAAVQEDMTEEGFYEYILENYEEVFVNTLLMYDVVVQLNNTKVRVHWWIHEPPMFFASLKENVEQPFWDELGDNVTVYAAGDFVHDWMKSQYKQDSYIINFGIEDVSRNGEEVHFEDICPDRVTFFIPSSTISYVKGQDIMLAAIGGLPEEYMQKAEFIFTGAEVPGAMQEFYATVVRESKRYNNVKMLPLIERKYLLQLMRQSDCIVAPSREDATNACMVEGMMLSKLCLCSDKTGVSRYMEDCVNGFIFPAGNAEELRARLMLIIDNIERLGVIAQNGRKVYEKNFSMEIFEGNIRKYWEKSL